MTLSIMTLSIMTLSIMTLGIMTLSIMTLSITITNMTLGMTRKIYVIYALFRNWAHYLSVAYYAKCRYVKCRSVKCRRTIAKAVFRCCQHNKGALILKHIASCRSINEFYFYHKITEWSTASLRQRLRKWMRQINKLK